MGRLRGVFIGFGRVLAEGNELEIQKKKGFWSQLKFMAVRPSGHSFLELPNSHYMATYLVQFCWAISPSPEVRLTQNLVRMFLDVGIISVKSHNFLNFLSQMTSESHGRRLTGCSRRLHTMAKRALDAWERAGASEAEAKQRSTRSATGARTTRHDA